MGISECLSPGAKTYSMGGLTIGCDNKSIRYDSAAGLMVLKNKSEAPKPEGPKLPALGADEFVGPPPKAATKTPGGYEPAKGLAVEVDGVPIAVPPPKGPAKHEAARGLAVEIDGVPIAVPYSAPPAGAGVSLPATAKGAPVRFSFTEAPALDEVTKQAPIRYGHKDGKGGAVSDVQRMLADAGYDVKVDGFFGKDTMKAVKEFQKANGLPPDGKVGPQTLAKLTELAKAKAPAESPPLDGNAPVPAPIGDGIGLA